MSARRWYAEIGYTVSDATRPAPWSSATSEDSFTTEDAARDWAEDRAARLTADNAESFTVRIDYSHVRELSEHETREANERDAAHAVAATMRAPHEITTGETGPDWSPTDATRYYAQRGEGRPAFGATVADALRNLAALESAPRPWKSPRVSGEWKRVRKLRAEMRREYQHAREYIAKARRTFRAMPASAYHLALSDAARSHERARATLRKLREDREFLARYGVTVPRGMVAGDEGDVWVNQGMRGAECLAVIDGRALVAYSMPAGRVFYWDVSAALEWSDLAIDGYGERVRNVSATKPAKRWAAVVASYNAACNQ